MHRKTAPARNKVPSRRQPKSPASSLPSALRVQTQILPSSKLPNLSPAARTGVCKWAAVGEKAVLRKFMGGLPPPPLPFSDCFSLTHSLSLSRAGLRHPGAAVVAGPHGPKLGDAVVGEFVRDAIAHVLGDGLRGVGVLFRVQPIQQVHHQRRGKAGVHLSLDFVTDGAARCLNNIIRFLPYVAIYGLVKLVRGSQPAKLLALCAVLHVVRIAGGANETGRSSAPDLKGRNKLVFLDHRPRSNDAELANLCSVSDGASAADGYKILNVAGVELAVGPDGDAASDCHGAGAMVTLNCWRGGSKHTVLHDVGFSANDDLVEITSENAPVQYRRLLPHKDRSNQNGRRGSPALGHQDGI
eukprot:RCo030175